MLEPYPLVASMYQIQLYLPLTLTNLTNLIRYAAVNLSALIVYSRGVCVSNSVLFFARGDFFNNKKRFYQYVALLAIRHALNPG